ncbi:MAG: helix-turn-helix transcriptional regulator [Ruminococcaceae bacterium]|nr:helix-turn-helix transcriptional regulator [Oscillospiraceae bacterium]
MKTARDSEPMVLFGTRLRALRKQHGLTQLVVAERLCVDRTTYNKYEAGRVSPDQRGLLTLSEMFSVTVDFLLGREPETTLAVAGAQVEGGTLLSDQEKVLLQNFRQMPPEDQQALVERIQKEAHHLEE